MSNIVHLHEPPRQIAHYLRVGFREHVLADRMRAEGRLHHMGVVFDACYVAPQRHLKEDLRADGHELILDTNAAEQSVIGRFSGTVGDAPWASKGAPLEVTDFKPGTNRSVIEPIARFAVAEGFHTVLAPTHYLGGDQGAWLDVDAVSAEALRRALNVAGGSEVRLFYPLIVDNAQIKDPNFVRRAVAKIQNLPVDAVWLRVSGFGVDATGAGIDRMVRAVLGFHELGIPVVMDRAGGLVACALSAFGATSGYSNGLKGRDRFQASDWLKPRTGSGGGGNERAVFVSGLDRRMKVSDMKALFQASTTARAVYGCNDSGCCASVDAMLREPEAHNLGAQSRVLSDLSGVPELRRAEYFLDTYVEGMRQKADRSTRLKKAPPEFVKTAEKAATRLNRMKDALEHTIKRTGQIEFAPEATLPSGIVQRGANTRRQP